MRSALFALASAAVLSGCAAPSGAALGGGPDRGPSARITECRAGDTEVASPAQCLADDAACYEMASGAYCTGARDTTCPAGSSPLPAGTECPIGARCISLSESLECVIG